MTAKQYLSQAYRLNERINSDLSELDRLRDLATSLSGVNYDGVRVSKTRSTEAPFEKTICKIIDAERKINAEIDRLVDLKAEISEAISQLANVDEQLLLRFRYINNYAWEKIAVLMSVSMRTVHQPAGNYIAGCRQMERAVKEGKVHAIGLSNFYRAQMEEILSVCEMRPVILQTEAHPYHQETALKAFLADEGIAIQAWYPLGHGDSALLGEPVFARLAEKYGKTSAQIILR